MADNYRAEYNLLVDKLAARGVDVEKVKARVKAQEIETPSWGFADREPDSAHISRPAPR